MVVVKATARRAIRCHMRLVRPKNYYHFHEDVGPTHFYKVILVYVLELLLIPNGFCKHMTNIPLEVVLKMNTGCKWRVTLQRVNRKIALDKGWAGFAIAHHIQIDYLVVFKVLIVDTFKMIVFDIFGAEAEGKCKKHHEALALFWEV
ncbi:hypothetical protein VPH35_106170 [Triticum aestivum]|uniref:TF-B3 domain-containing protein n=1 Tax=Triticum aestivum TaxID=4565 RepID=A0A3B6NVI9_WHEAT